MIAEAIRKQLERIDGLRAEALSPLAEQYGQEVEKVNVRLDEALRLLSRGLRSEAIQLANVRPGVIEWAAKLDFPEYADWVEILQFLNVPVPPQLNREAVEQLQQAIVEEQPLEKLLREHRRLAIAKAPLSWRLKVLREMSRKDVANVVWLEDIECWERARIKEIPAELRDAQKREDLAACRSLSYEIARTKWRIRIPDNLRAEVVQTYDSLLLVDHRKQASEIAVRLNAAFGEFNEPAGRAAREAWHRLEQAASGRLPAGECELAEPALLWLQQIDDQERQRKSHRLDLLALEEAITADSTLHDLETAYHNVLRWELGIDETLAQRYEAIHTRKTLQSKRRAQIITSGLAATAAVLIIAVGILVWNRNYAIQLATATSELNALLEEKKLADANAFVERIRESNPRLGNAPALASLVSQLESALDDEQRRANTLAGSLETLEKLEAPEISLTSLREAEQLARTDDERAAVSKVRRKFEQFEKNVAATQLQAVTESLSAVDQALQGIEAAGVTEADEAKFSAVERKIADLRSQYPRAGTRGEDLLILTKKKLDSLRSAMRETQEIEFRLRSALRAVRGAENTQQLGQAIDALLMDVPNSSLTPEFLVASREKPLWNSIGQWNELCADIAVALDDELTVQEAEKILTAADLVAESLGKHPAEAKSPLWREELRALPKRGEVLDSLVSDLSQAVMKDMKTVMGRGVPAAGGQETQIRYYVHNEYFEKNKAALSKNTGQFGLEAVGDGTGAVGSQSLAGRLQIFDEPRGTIAELLRNLGSKKDRIIFEWDREILTQIAFILRRENLDYRIKEMLIERLVRAARAGSPLMDAQLQSATTTLESGQEERNLWYEGAPLVSALPASSNNGLVAALSAAFKASSPLGDRLQQLAQRRYAMAGVLVRGGSNEIEAVVGQPKAQGKLLVAIPQDSQSHVVLFREVGELRSGEALLSSGDDLLVAGRPLFVVVN